MFPRCGGVVEGPTTWNQTTTLTHRSVFFTHRWCSMGPRCCSCVCTCSAAGVHRTSYAPAQVSPVAVFISLSLWESRSPASVPPPTPVITMPAAQPTTHRWWPDQAWQLCACSPTAPSCDLYCCVDCTSCLGGFAVCRIVISNNNMRCCCCSRLPGLWVIVYLRPLLFSSSDAE